jgi:hypothetical protein
MASRGLSAVLEVVEPEAQKSVAVAGRDDRVDSADGRGESAVGRGAHPWRSAQARHRGRQADHTALHR